MLAFARFVARATKPIRLACPPFAMCLSAFLVHLEVFLFD